MQFAARAYARTVIGIYEKFNFIVTVMLRIYSLTSLSVPSALALLRAANALPCWALDLKPGEAWL